MAICLGLLLTGLLFLFTYNSHAFHRKEIEAEYFEPPINTSEDTKLAAPTALTEELTILVDDFESQPYVGTEFFFFNRLDGDRGTLGDVEVDWGDGQVTATVSSGNWGGAWTSLNHPIRETNPINLSAVLPPQITPTYQVEATGLQILVSNGSPGNQLRIELKDELNNAIRWSTQVTLTGGTQSLSLPLNPLTDTTTLLWFLEGSEPGDYVVVDRVTLTASTSISDTSERAFVWSYGMLLNNWDAETGLVRDQARSAGGEFDAIQSTGSLAAATAIASQLGIIKYDDAVEIVNTISATLLTKLPRYHGLWPHWVEITPSGNITIEHRTEWSSIDTAIAAVGLLEAQSALGLDTSGVEHMLQQIDWDDLVRPNGISHGYSYSGTLLTSSWDTFGGESWLMQLVYASVTAQVAPMPFTDPPTANGSGFTDEIMWLFAPVPTIDYWGNNWQQYRLDAVAAQLAYYPTDYPDNCFDQLDVFVLSSGEVPEPSIVPQAQIYQAFGVGGRFAPANDGKNLIGSPVIVPHYAGLVASLEPERANDMWGWMIGQGIFTPLNNTESLMFDTGATNCGSSEVSWNHSKGSWNLALQTLGWGRYLAERQGQTPVLWQAITSNSFLRGGYLRLVPTPLISVQIQGPSDIYTQTTTVFTATYEPLEATQPVTITWSNNDIGETTAYHWPMAGQYVVAVTATNRAEIPVTATHPVTVHPIHGLGFAPDRHSSAMPGTVITYVHILTNVGNYTDTFRFTHWSSQGWSVSYPNTVTLGKGQVVSIVVAIGLPTHTLTGIEDTTVISATSESDNTVTAGVTDRTKAGARISIPFIVRP
jgi:hypothetical protein